MKIVFATVGAEYVGIELMAARLKEVGHNVVAFVDESLFDDKIYFSVPPLARLFNRRKDVIRQIVDEKPDLLGISVITNGFLWAQEVAAGVKAQLPNVKVIMGGIHVTSVPEVVIAKDCVDMICVGEGFNAMSELVQSLEDGEDRTDIANIWYKRNGEIIRNEQRREMRDADSLPLLDKTIYENEIPLHHTYMTMSQYGCPFKCAFCAVTTVAENSKKHGGKPLQFRSVDKVIEEIAHYREKYGFKSVYFMTNTFTSSKPWMREWAEKYPKALNLPYKISTHPTRIDDEIAKMLKDTNCYTVQLGVESFSEEVRAKVFHRFETNDHIRAATKAMDDAGLRYTLDYIMGAPLQTEEEYREFAAFVIGLKNCFRVTPFILSFYPATPMVDIARKYGYLTDENVERMNEGLDPNFITRGSVLNYQTVNKLNVWRFFLRIIPIIPRPVARYLLKNDRFKIFRFLPLAYIILGLDVILSLIARDYVALSYLRRHLWYFRKAVTRKLGGARMPSSTPPSAPTRPTHGDLVVDPASP